jgi:hypothetical protein
MSQRAIAAALGIRFALACLAGALGVSAADPAGAGSPTPLDVREPCAEHDPLRRPLFGDLHVHTALSHDASTQATRNLPRDAYRFAQGEPLGIQPYAADGSAMRTLQLDRPLDFAAVTDHAELLGELRVCDTRGLPGYDAWLCRLHRRWPRASFFLISTHVARGTGRRMGFCGPDGSLCLEAAVTPWNEIRSAAEAAYDRSAACRFTSFVGYEWTASIVGRNLHRNVIFRNARVPALPTSYYEATTHEELWAALREQCTEAGIDCDALVIPHNSNLSAGLMFRLEDDLSADQARERSWWEPVVEVMQHKGDSECLWEPGGADEECAFEQLPFDSFRGKFFGFLQHEPRREDSVRYALLEGLRSQAERGANPFKLGQVGSTDTHLGTPGYVDETAHPGHGGAGAPSPDSLPPGLPDDVFFNPGGLAVVWAEENSRDAIFEALRRREVYGTSGPRLVVRFFGGWGYPEDLCQRADLAATGYAQGVPMGGDLPVRDGERSPAFVVSALRDPGGGSRPGAPLERIQIVKGWLEDGEPREQVVDVVGAPGGKRDGLCRVWRDPDFDPAAPAFWYARVLETPTPRWHTYVCRSKNVNCEDPGEGLEACCDPAIPQFIRERAWTSPIWWTP